MYIWIRSRSPRSFSSLPVNLLCLVHYVCITIQYKGLVESPTCWLKMTNVFLFTWTFILWFLCISCIYDEENILALLQIFSFIDPDSCQTVLGMIHALYTLLRSVLNTISDPVGVRDMSMIRHDSGALRNALIFKSVVVCDWDSEWLHQSRHSHWFADSIH